MSGMRQQDGTVMQSGLSQNPNDYDHERLYGPVVGVILAVHFSDDPLNASAKDTTDQRGSQTTCDVLVVSHGNDNPWVVPNVVVLPEGPTGVDDFCESIPRPCSFMTDGSQLDIRFASTDLTKLDGDWCVVGFIGGSIEHPVMLKWWPHPGNRRDPATSGFPIQNSVSGPADGQTLVQGRRMFRRYAGMKLTITSEGSIFVDTNESNAAFTGTASGPQRQPRVAGGDVQFDIKNQRQLEVNFNPPVALPVTQPSLPQPNPPRGQNVRSTDSTVLTMDKDQLLVTAGKLIRLFAQTQTLQAIAKTDATVEAQTGKVTVQADEGEVDIIAATKVATSAPDIEETATTKIGMQAPEIDETASANMNLTAGANMDVSAGANMSLAAGANLFATASALMSLLAPQIEIGGAISPLPLWNLFLAADQTVWTAILTMLQTMTPPAPNPPQPTTPFEVSLVAQFKILIPVIQTFITGLTSSQLGPPFSSVIARNG